VTRLDQPPGGPAAIPVSGQQYRIGAGSYRATVTGLGGRACVSCCSATSRRRKALAIEPMTCPPNAFVTGDDLLVLQPGDAVTHTWGIQVFTQ
jgi:galactose mutarotase-like enzyme